MKAIGGPQKLRFTVQSCSGEDSDYPARELLYHSPQTRGWQSPRFCKFPQEIVLRLEKPAKVQQIQILAHEFKIPTKVEVYVAPPGGEQQQLPDGSSAPAASKRLGYLSFDSNERSGHQARELKSVHVSVDAAALRLVVHRCHVNKLNIYNQVGIVALNLIGDPLGVAAQPGPHGGGGAYLDVGGQPAAEMSYYNRSAAAMADLSLDVHVDATTASKVRELGRLKEAAVAAEEYDEAKRLKAAIERLKALGQKIAQLEARKRSAVEREDYDLAKALKSDIEKLRTAGDGAALADGGGIGGLGGGGLGSPGAGGAAQPFPGSSGRGAPVNFDDRVVGRGQGKPWGNGGAEDSAPDVGGGPFDGRASPQGPAASGEASGAWGDGEPGAAPSGGGGGLTGMARRHSGYYAYEERPAVARGGVRGSEGGVGGAGGAFPGDDGGLADADPSAVSAAMFGSGGGAGGGGGSSVEAPAPAGWPRELPPPEPMAGAAAKDGEAVAEVAGEYVAAAFCSRNWQLRDAALSWVADLVKNGKVSGPERRDLARSLARLAAKSMKDKVPNVFHSGVGLLLALVDAMAGAGRDVAASVEQALPVLIERLGDSNARLRDGARDALLALAENRDSGLRYSGGNAALLRPVKSQTAWRPVLSTLQLLQDLVPLIGVSQGGGGGGGRSAGGASSGGAGAEGLDLGDLMDYVGRAFGSANADVRGAAVKVAVLVHDAVGPAMLRLLPRDMNPKIREQVDAALGVEGGGSPPVPAAQQQAPTPAPKARAGATPKTAPPSAAKAGARGSTGGARAGGGGGGGAAPRKAGPGGGAQQHQQPLPPHLQHSHEAPQRQQKQQQQQPAISHDDLEAMADDPGPFEAELRGRERQYGPGHPAVAESCSNLAILYNQRGEYDRAKPLYERALGIYEATYGPDHQEVAHTLTDLAVLHLEQGHDDIGRPLLERALVIQEGALGPDHPDVIAIRDVLNSE